MNPVMLPLFVNLKDNCFDIIQSKWLFLTRITISLNKYSEFVFGEELDLTCFALVQ